MSALSGATHIRVGRPTSTGALTPAERSHVATFADPRRATEFQAARSWLRSVLSDYLDTDPLALPLATGTWGKPYLVGHDLHFNLSHTGGLCALAVSDRPVGIDVESVTRNLRTALNRCASPRERRRLRGCPIADVVAVWTVKEAYAKALGLGHRCTFAALETEELLGGGPWAVRDDRDLPVEVRYDVPGHVLAVAHASGSPVIAIDFAQVVALARAQPGQRRHSNIPL